MTSQLIVGKELRRLGKGVLDLVRSRHLSKIGEGGLTRTHLAAIGVFCLLPIAATAALYYSIPKETLTADPVRTPTIEKLRLPDLRGQMAAIEAVSDPISHELFAREGETLTSLLARLSIKDKAARDWILRSAEARDLAYPKQGQFVTAVAGEDGRLEELRLFADSDVSGQTSVLEVRRTDKGFEAHTSPFAFDTELTMSTGVVAASPDASLLDAGVPAKIVEQMHSAFDADRDVVSSLKRGDAFRLIYETKFYEGGFVRHGRLLAMQLDHGGKTTELFRFDNDGTGGNFYDARGQISRRTFMRVPLDVKSVTSEFAPMRRHPVTGVLRPHKGTDFRAHWGALVRAAADGTVEFAGVGTGYGKYIRIEHGPGIETLYAHLSSIEAKVKPGQKVRYGEVIGRVGQTGLATGPHLHYELKFDNVQINPMTVRLPDSRSLTPYQYAQMEVLIAPLRARLARLQKVQVTSLATQNNEAVQTH